MSYIAELYDWAIDTTRSAESRHNYRKALEDTSTHFCNNILF